MQDATQQRPGGGQRDFSLSEAAQVTGLSRVTIRRYLDAGRFPNAFRDPYSARRPVPWRVPAADLTQAGLSLTEPMTPQREPQLAERAGGPSQGEPLDTATELAVLRAVASERERLISILDAANERLLQALIDLSHIAGRRSDSGQSPPQSTEPP